MGWILSLGGHLAVAGFWSKMEVLSFNVVTCRGQGNHETFLKAQNKFQRIIHRQMLKLCNIGKSNAMRMRTNSQQK